MWYTTWPYFLTPTITIVSALIPFCVTERSGLDDIVIRSELHDEALNKFH